MDESPFNPDELAVQALAGGGPRGGAGIRDFMPEQHRQFFAQLPYVFLGAVDSAGWPLATVLTGAPGFVQSPDPFTLHIAAFPDAEDPAADALAPDREIGVLGIDFAMRRRNRANGRIARSTAAGIDVAVSQTFGNCPQYIQRRVIEAASGAMAQGEPARGGLAHAASSPVESFTRLDAAARAAIEKTGTFFVASRSRAGRGSAYGADISHRGGRPGFVRIDGEVLTIPDFRGNRYFNTLGNLSAEPRASLLFVDFESGDLLQLQGMVQLDWKGAAAAQFAGAERLWHFRVTRGWRRKAALPLRWAFMEYSRTTLESGQW
jgi:predicted pyridoxine 5'-phosphate oxidase superfamily flavin-nucleotide-binding protein